MKTFHIRAPLPRNRSNQFYLDNAPRIAKTLCGAPVGEHDNRFSWQVFAAGDYVPCERCVEIRRTELQTKGKGKR